MDKRCERANERTLSRLSRYFADAVCQCPSKLSAVKLYQIINFLEVRNAVVARYTSDDSVRYLYCRFNAGSLVLKNRDIHPCFFQLKQSDNNTVVAKNDDFINVLNQRLKTTTSREDLSPMRW